MNSEFDPYRHWLGIKSEERPLNYYQLLGINELEDRVDIIDAASIKRVDRIQDIASAGKYSELSQQILNEIAAARLCLMDPDSRQSYELSVMKKQAGLASISKRMESSELSKPNSNSTKQPPNQSVSISTGLEKKKPRTTVPKRKSSGTPFIYTAGMYLLVAIGVSLAAFKVIELNSKQSANNSPATTDQLDSEPVVDLKVDRAANVKVEPKAGAKVEPEVAQVARGQSSPKPATKSKPSLPSIAYYGLNSDDGIEARSITSPESQGWTRNQKLDPEKNKEVKPDSGPAAWLVGDDSYIGPHYTINLTSDDYAQMWERGWQVVIFAKPTSGSYIFGWASPKDQKHFNPRRGPRVILTTTNKGYSIRLSWKAGDPIVKIPKKGDDTQFCKIVLSGEPMSNEFKTRVWVVDDDNKITSKKPVGFYTSPLLDFKELRGMVGWTTGANSANRRKPSALIRRFRMYLRTNEKKPSGN